MATFDPRRVRILAVSVLVSRKYLLLMYNYLMLRDCTYNKELVPKSRMQPNSVVCDKETARIAIKRGWRRIRN
jgi:hypothetical protein